MNRSITTRPLVRTALALVAALCLFTGCDDGDGADPNPPVTDGGPPADAGPEPDPVLPDVSLAVSADARACEVMLFDPEGQLGAVVFADAVEGRTMRRGDRLALAFAHRADTPIAGGAVALVAEADAAGVRIESGACFDADGRPLADAGVALNVL